MAKRKNGLPAGRHGKNNHKGSGFKIPLLSLFHISLPEKATRLIWGVFTFVLALIYVFAFFGKAGSVGNALFNISQYLFGKSVFLLPLFLSIAGFTFFKMAEYRIVPIASAFVLSLIGVNGILGTISRARGLSFGDLSGAVGFAVSLPFMQAFGFWVSAVVFSATLVVSGIIFWNLLPHEEIEKITKSEPVEKVRKIFEPKFEVSAVDAEPELEPKIHDAIQRERQAKLKGNPSTNLGQGRKKKGAEFFPAQALEGNYKLPPADLLEQDSGSPSAGDIQAYSAIIKKTFQNFDIPVEVSEINIGPTVTQYSIKPAEGVKLSRITGLSNDLSLALAAHPIRIEAPIPGKALVGIEVPNKARAQVRLRSLIESENFQNSSSPLMLALGRDVSGNGIVSDLSRMPHLLVAGATGTGKTIGLNNIILSLLYRNSPYNLRLILVDPKRVEFPVYNDLPHLLTPVILDTQRTINALKWLIKEMERRFQVLSSVRVRDIKSYHVFVAEQMKKNPDQAGNGAEYESIPYIVVIIDELADLMAARGKEMEGMIVRLAQMSRAVGIHLVLATQRPSVEVITGLIKANITSRIAFQVASQIDSRTILDGSGAEKLLGQGDMLFISAEISKPKRIQGAFISDKEVKRVVAWIAKESGDFVREEIEDDELAKRAQESLESSEFGGDDDDPLYEEAKRQVLEYKKASASLLQRRLKIGYARAARLLDILESKGVIGPGDGAKAREVFAASQNPDSSLALNDPEPPPKEPLGEAQQEEESKDSQWFSP